jgi:hypothetical protein
MIGQREIPKLIDQQAAAGRVGPETQLPIDHVLAQPPDAADLGHALGHHLVNWPARILAALPAELVDQQFLELLGLEADQIRLHRSRRFSRG